jgi:hypothetical protein
MINTVFIVGAGASAEVGLPVGSGLAERIGRLLDIQYRNFNELTSGDILLAETLQYCAQRNASGQHDQNQLFAAGRLIGQAMAASLSIDNFIDWHRGNAAVELCGKLAIARAIVHAEKTSKLYTDVTRPNDILRHDRAKGTWLNDFWKLLSDGCNIEERWNVRTM